jgi:GT2 family glycosyltransferase
MTPEGERGEAPDLAIVIVNWNTRELLRACLTSLEDHPAGAATEVWVVDNASEDGSADMVGAEFPRVRLIRNLANVGFSAANNQAIQETEARFILLLNSDTEVGLGTLATALDVVRRGKTTVAARLLNSDGTLQHSCFRFPRLGPDLLEAFYLHKLLPARWRGRMLLGGYWPHAEERVVDWAIGAFLLVPREAVEAAGSLSEDYFLFGEDMEWCFRLTKAGFPVVFAPEAALVHHGNQSAGQRAPEWRIRRTHQAKYQFCEDHLGRTRAGLHRWIDSMGYRVRRELFRLLGILSTRRKTMGENYAHILRAMKSDE